jgi:hypothetical protein
MFISPGVDGYYRAGFSFCHPGKWVAANYLNYDSPAFMFVCTDQKNVFWCRTKDFTQLKIHSDYNLQVKAVHKEGTCSMVAFEIIHFGF